MDILLTHGYFLYEDPKELQIMKPYPPLGILYICSHLRQKGLSAEVFDSTFSSRQELWDLLREGPPSVIGVYANLMTRSNVVEILRMAKECGWRTLVGGPEPGAYIQEYLAAGADVVVIGEGEITLEELVPALHSKASDKLHDIAGIAFLAPNGSIIRTKPREQIKDINAQPWPARESIDMSRYVEVWRQHHGMGSVSLITARGCPYHCRWCSHSTYGKTHRRRSPAGVAEEVAWIAERYQPEMLWMADDVFTIHPGWIGEYSAQMQRRGLRIPFECITRADRMNARTAATLASLGCFRVWIGSESGSQKILDAMQRGVRVDQVREAVRLLRDNRIETGMFLMWGYEGEDLGDIEATVEHVKTCRPDVFLTTVSYPIKGTPYYGEVAPRLVRLGEWATSTDRDTSIRGRHSRHFYQLADLLLKNEVAGLTAEAGDARRRLREAFDEVEA